VRSYVGTRGPSGCTVTVLDKSRSDESYLLPLRLDLANKSPTGFEWAYAGSGPAQLALALLADALGDDEKAMTLMQDFKFKVVGRLPREGWQMSQEEIRQAVEQIEAGRGRGR
jgi:hypothetical protein